MPAPTSWCQASDVESAAERTADIRLAVTAMLQALPPRQRGVFVLRDVIGCTAAETADVLAMTPSAVNSALQRARSALRETTGLERGLDPASVERYARAIETADLDELATLVADDVVLEMPPVPSWSRGKESYLAFMAQLFAWRGTRWETRPILANSQPAMLLYRLTEEGPEAHTLQLFDAGDSGTASEGDFIDQRLGPNLTIDQFCAEIIDPICEISMTSKRGGSIIIWRGGGVLSGHTKFEKFVRDAITTKNIQRRADNKPPLSPKKEDNQSYLLTVVVQRGIEKEIFVEYTPSPLE